MHYADLDGFILAHKDQLNLQIPCGGSTTAAFFQAKEIEKAGKGVDDLYGIGGLTLS